MSAIFANLCKLSRFKTSLKAGSIPIGIGWYCQPCQSGDGNKENLGSQPSLPLFNSSPLEMRLTSQFLKHSFSPCSLPTTTLILPSLEKDEMKMPSLIHTQKVDPLAPLFDICEPVVNYEILDPLEHIEKHAVRLIVIRRRKMRIHKLKKRRKKHRFAIAKKKLRKKMLKEKVFQAEQLVKIKAAHDFNAADYVVNMIHKSKEEPDDGQIAFKRYYEAVMKKYRIREEKAKAEAEKEKA